MILRRHLVLPVAVVHDAPTAVFGREPSDSPPSVWMDATVDDHGHGRWAAMISSKPSASGGITGYAGHTTTERRPLSPSLPRGLPTRVQSCDGGAWQRPRWADVPVRWPYSGRGAVGGMEMSVGFSWCSRNSHHGAESTQTGTSNNVRSIYL